MTAKLAVKTYKLRAAEKRIVARALTGDIGTNEATRKLNITTTALYILMASLLRYAVRKGMIDAEALLKDY